MTIHGTKYDYSKVDLTLPIRTKVEIICPDHGSFFQRRDSHLSGAKCKLCRNKEATGNYKYTTESFIEKIKCMNNGDLIYDKVIFNGTANKVTVICPRHGEYEVKAGSLLIGYGCQKCNGDKQRTTLAEFKTRSTELHNNFYDYSSCAEITNTKQKLDITCPIHGLFSQSYMSHLTGKGCRKCASERRVAPTRITNEEFISRSSVIHKDKYDYSLVQMNGVDNYVDIICPVHGKFSQTASCHLTGRGCRLCRNDSTTYDMVDRYRNNIELGEKEGFLYIAEMSSQEESFIKIGITSNWKGRRKQYSKIKDIYSFTMLYQFTNKNINCAILERELFRYLKSLNLKYKPLNNFIGRSECFTKESLVEALKFIEGYNFER